MRKKNKLSTPFYRDVVRLKLLLGKDNTLVVVALLLVISLLLPCCHGQKHDLRKNLEGKLNANSGEQLSYHPTTCLVGRVKFLRKQNTPLAVIEKVQKL